MSDTTAVPPAPKSDTHFHVPTWVAVVAGGVLVLAVGFVVGRVSQRRHDRAEFAGPADRFGQHTAGRGVAFVVFLLLLALVVAVVALLVRHFSSRNHAASSAEELLAGRFARGEISEDEFRSRRAAIRG
jgi:putative membrane protein